MTETAQHRPTLVLGGTGKTGRRLVERLTRQDLPVRIGSRAGGLPFDWEQPATWGPVFTEVEAAYTYVPDLVVSNPAEALAGVVQAALAAGTRRLVLLSGRGADKAEACEKVVMSSGADWTILRASFFNQNFSEGYLLGPILAGQVRLPAGEVGEPFCDTADIADVAATVLIEGGHVGAIYELTGPRALTFGEATATIAGATGRDITYIRIPPEEFAADLAADSVPPGTVDVLVDLFGAVLDGRNTAMGDGVEHVLGRPARDFADYARVTAATGVWTPGRPDLGGPR